MRLATSTSNPTSQERRSRTHAFSVRSRANTFCDSRLQTHIAEALHQIDQFWSTLQQ